MIHDWSIAWAAWNKTLVVMRQAADKPLCLITTVTDNKTVVDLTP